MRFLNRFLPVGLGLLPAAMLATFLLLPLIALLLRGSAGLGGVDFGSRAVSDALLLSLLTSVLALALIVAFGTPLAWALSRRSWPGSALVEAIVDAPLLLPPVVAGVALLAAFGRIGLIGQVIPGGLGYSTLAVILAQMFVATPLFVRSARAGFDSVDRRLEKVAQTLGVPPLLVFWRVTVPLARPALASGAVLAWARSLGEFGATLMFAGNLPGSTQTLPLAISELLEYDLDAALALSLLLLLVAVALLVLLRLISPGAKANA